MKPEIIKKVCLLGGFVEEFKDESLKSKLEAINFKNSLYDHDWGFYGFDEFMEKERKLYEKNKEAFFEKMASDYLSADENKPLGQSFWRKDFFAPMTEGSNNYEEWQEIFNKPELTDFTEIQKVIGESPLEFIQILFSYGYPDHYYICLSDPQPNNPTVFGTDHEVFFKEIRNCGSLENFLDRFWTKSELIEALKTEV